MIIIFFHIQISFHFVFFSQHRTDTRMISFFEKAMHVCSYVHVCFVNYLEQHTVLYKVDRQNDDRNSPRVECRLLLTRNEHAWQLQHQPRKPVNIVISDMDTSNTCDRPLIKFLWSFCCEWTCSSPLFRKFQVKRKRLFSLSLSSSERIAFRISWPFLFWMHLWICSSSFVLS